MKKVLCNQGEQNGMIFLLPALHMNLLEWACPIAARTPKNLTDIEPNNIRRENSQADNVLSSTNRSANNKW